MHNTERTERRQTSTSDVMTDTQATQLRVAASIQRQRALLAEWAENIADLRRTLLRHVDALGAGPDAWGDRFTLALDAEITRQEQLRVLQLARVAADQRELLRLALELAS